MDILIAPKIHEVTESVNFLPAVSIIMPFDPKMKSKALLNNSLKMATSKVEWELHENYEGDMAELLIEKLKAILSNLNFSTHTISIAIYVSPVFEKVLYLNIPVEENVVVDESFEIRNLVYSKKELRKYVVLLLSNKECRIYLGHPEKFIKVLSNTPKSAYTYLNKTCVGSVNYSEVPEQRELIVEYLRYTDNVLDIMLNAYPDPLFVLGNENVLEHFKKLTKHSSAIIEYVEGNFEEFNVQQLKEIMALYVADWQKVKQKKLLNKLKEAAVKRKLVVGMRDVCLDAMTGKSRLLVVEKNYRYATNQESTNNLTRTTVKGYNRFSYIKNPLDKVIEKVLEKGGEVEFVDKGILNGYDRIALIK